MGWAEAMKKRELIGAECLGGAGKFGVVEEMVIEFFLIMPRRQEEKMGVPLFSSRTLLITREIAGRKRSESKGRGERAGACGARWPSGARPSRPSQTVQVAGLR